jgi:pyrroloquinoline quinone biosynthesis protein D
MPNFDLNSRPALAPGVRLQLDKVTGEVVLLYPEGVLELNGTAHAIVNLCTGAASVAEIVAALATEYEVEESVLRQDALDCLDDLARRNLIVPKP